MRHYSTLNRSMLLMLVLAMLGGPVVRASAQDEEGAVRRKPLKEEVWVGKGYDITDKYADVTSVRESAFDIGSDDEGDPVVFSGAETVPIEVVPNRGTALDDFFGKTVREYQTNFSARLNVEGSYGLFSGQLKTSFALDENGSTSREFATLMHVVTTKAFKLPYVIEKSMVRPECQNFIDSADPKSVFARFGTHYIWQADVGGRVDFNFTKKDTASDKTLDLRVEAKAAVNGLVNKLSVEAETNFKNFEKKIEENGSYKIVSHGGNLDVGAALRQNRTELGEWTRSIEEKPTLCRFNKQSLRPIWDLASTDARKAELQKAFAAYVKAGGIVDTEGRIDVRRTNQLVMFGTNWHARNTEGDRVSSTSRIGVFQPIPDPEQGYYIVGQAVSNNSDPTKPANVDSILVKELGEAGKLLAQPLGFSLVYTDKGAGPGAKDWSIWRANCPVKFVALGYFAKFTHNPPDASTFRDCRCVHESLVERAAPLSRSDVVFNGEVMQGAQKILVYRIRPARGSNAVDGNFFFPDSPVAYNSPPPNVPLYVLKNPDANAGGEGSVGGEEGSVTPAAASAPTPSNQGFDREEVEMFVEVLRESLGEVVEDEAVVASIAAKWEPKLGTLVGKTQKQIVELLFTDVKAAVKDATTTGEVWEMWNSIEIE
jgi:hypothetical protein